MHKRRLPFEYEADDRADSVTAWGGLPLISEVFTALGIDESIARHIKLRKSRRDFDSTSLVKAGVMLMAAGGDCLDDMQMLREDAALAKLLNTSFPSPETFRQFLYEFHDDVLVERAEREALFAGLKSFIPDETERLKGLAAVNADFVAEVARRWPQTEATIDIDATIQQSSKREAKTHYKGQRGYQPTVAIWAEQDLVVADQFRDGNVPAHHSANLDVIQRAFAAVPSSVTKRFLRGDAALGTRDVLEWLCGHGVEFAVGAQTSKAFREACLAVAPTDWLLVEERSDSDVHICEVPATTALFERLPVHVLAVRVSRRQGEMFDGEADAPLYLCIVTNRTLHPVAVARWYWDKAGTIEHVHDIVKNDLGGAVLPCGRFGANAAWFRLALLTYNVLRVVRLTGPEDLKHARPKRLRLNLLALPTVVIRHARQLIARVANRVRRAFAIDSARNALWLSHSW